MELDFLSSIIKGDNNPPDGKIVFDSSDHVRFQNGQNVVHPTFRVIRQSCSAYSLS